MRLPKVRSSEEGDSLLSIVFFITLKVAECPFSVLCQLTPFFLCCEQSEIFAHTVKMISLLQQEKIRTAASQCLLTKNMYEDSPNYNSFPNTQISMNVRTPPKYFCTTIASSLALKNSSSFLWKTFFFLKHWYLFSHILETFFSSQAFVHPRFGGPKHWRESDHVAFILKIIPNMSSA